MSVTPWKIRRRVRKLLSSSLQTGLQRLRAVQGKTQPAPSASTSARFSSPGHVDAHDASVHQLLEHGSFPERLQAVQALSKAGGEQVRRALEAALADPAAEVAMAAADALVELGARESERALAEVLTDANGYYAPVTRARAAVALRRLLAHEAVNHLLIAINDANADVSATAIAVLGELGDIRAREPLLRVLKRTNFYLPENRRRAVVALAQLGLSKSELEALVQADPDPMVRAAVTHLNVAGG